LVDGRQGCFLGIVIALGAAAVRRNAKMRFVVLPFVILLLLALQKFQPDLPLNKTLLGPEFGEVRLRLGIYLFLSSSAAVMAYVTLMAFMGTQGVRLVRTRTELELAEKLQQTLAPPLAVTNAGYEIQGRSVPSSQMGGDLLDAVDDHGAMACYVADVAGHGIQAGVFMGMVKSSARTALLRPGTLAGFLADLNRVLFEIKAGSATYATFACLRCGERGKVEYSLAGNGPILHYCARSRTTSQLAIDQFPLGLFANATFRSGSVEVDPGDILVLLTDGLPEVTDVNDEQFGIERIGEIVVQNAHGPLAELTEMLFAAVRRHGQQTDDETLVLVRATCHCQS
jgi:serine phosphatase RsbU (regulator of sigma subunit)